MAGQALSEFQGIVWWARAAGNSSMGKFVEEHRRGWLLVWRFPKVSNSLSYFLRLWLSEYIQGVQQKKEAVVLTNANQNLIQFGK